MPGSNAGRSILKGEKMAISPVILKKLVATALDERARKAAAVMTTSCLMPIILLILMIASAFSETNAKNKELLDYSFAGTSLPSGISDKQRGTIENMREWLGELDGAIDEFDGGSIDENMVRAAFYCLNFGGELDEDFSYRAFCNCFDGLTIEQLETALQNVSGEFPQYEITEILRYSVEKTYEYLKGE